MQKLRKKASADRVRDMLEVLIEAADSISNAISALYTINEARLCGKLHHTNHNRLARALYRKLDAFIDEAVLRDQKTREMRRSGERLLQLIELRITCGMEVLEDCGEKYEYVIPYEEAFARAYCDPLTVPRRLNGILKKQINNNERDK